MSAYTIVTDNIADLFDDYPKDDGVKVVSFPVQVDGEVFDCDSKESVERFFATQKSGERAKILHPRQQQIYSIFDEILMGGKDVLYIGVSQALSKGMESVDYIAKGMRIKYPNRRVEIVDSLCVAGGEGLLVHYAQKMHKEGKLLDEVLGWVLSARHRVEHLILLDGIQGFDTFEGTKTLLQGFGTVNIKPLLTVNDVGGISLLQKQISKKKAVADLAKRFESRHSKANEFALLSYTTDRDSAVTLATELTNSTGIEVKVGSVGAICSLVAGKDALALYYLTD